MITAPTIRDIRVLIASTRTVTPGNYFRDVRKDGTVRIKTNCNYDDAAKRMIKDMLTKAFELYTFEVYDHEINRSARWMRGQTVTCISFKKEF